MYRHHRGTDRVRHVCRVHGDGEDQPERVDDGMPLAPRDLLPGRSPEPAPLFRVADRLAVHDRARKVKSDHPLSRLWRLPDDA